MATCVFRIQQSVAPVTARPPVPEPATESADLVPTLLAGTAWQTLLDGALRSFIERDVLVPFLRRQRWMSSRADEIASARFVEWATLQDGLHPAFLTIVDTTLSDGATVQSLVPLVTTPRFPRTRDGRRHGTDHRRTKGTDGRCDGRRRREPAPR